VNRINRREFTRQLLASLATAPLLPSHFRLAAKDPWRPSSTPRKRVIVLGAGLAGLSAAYELNAAGHDVVVLEAKQGPGGRVLTIRSPFPDGLYAEVGPTRISDLNDWTLKYVSTLGLGLEPFKLPGRDVVHIRGKRIVVTDESKVDWPLDLTAEERRLGLPGMRAKYIGAVLDEIGDGGVPEAPPRTLAKYDSLSYAEFLRRQGASPDAIHLLTLGSNSNAIGQVSALMRLRAAVWRGKTKTWSKIRGGNDQLPKAFARALADRIHYDRPATHIEHTSSGVRVVVERRDLRETFEGDYLVSTIPLPVLRRISITPALPSRVERVIRDYGYASATKVVLQTRTRFWEAEGLSGFALTDRPAQEIWNLAAAQPGPRGLLVVFVTTPRGAGPIETDRVAWGVREAEHLFPGIARALEDGVSYCWEEDPWARGAFPQPRPGELIDSLSILRKPVGRVVFAGDYASAWPGWMQGALESGNHAARTIDAAV